MITENRQDKNQISQVWSWILVVIGGLFSLVGLFLIISSFASRNQFLGERIIVLVLEFLVAVAFLVVGGPLFILGLWRFRIRKGNSRQKWGWSSIAIGSLYTLLAIVIFIGLLLEPDSDIPGFYLICAIPFLVLGIPCIILGIQEKKPTEIISTKEP